MVCESLSLELILCRALRRAGIVTAYRHSCRRKSCGHREEAPDASLRRCPTCNMKLWPHGLVRPIRFHHLRHTTASLLMMAGANPAAVQRIMRHSDPRTTTEVYGHLAPGYLRSEIDRLQLVPPAPDAPRISTPVSGGDGGADPITAAFKDILEFQAPNIGRGRITERMGRGGTITGTGRSRRLIRLRHCRVSSCYDNRGPPSCPPGNPSRRPTARRSRCGRCTGCVPPRRARPPPS